MENGENIRPVYDYYRLVENENYIYDFSNFINYISVFYFSEKNEDYIMIINNKTFEIIFASVSINKEFEINKCLCIKIPKE